MVNNLSRYILNEKYRAIGTCFFMFSILFALWITRIPEIKTRLMLTEGQLGTALFFFPLGAITSMLVSNNLIRKLGEGRSTVLALLSFGFAMILPISAQSYAMLCFYLFIPGLCMGWVDISINAVANTLEKIDDVKIMSTSHGFFSLGGIAGGVIGGLLAESQVNGLAQFGFGSFMMVLTVLLVISPAIRKVHDSSNSEHDVIFALPGRPLLGLAVIAFCCMMAEGAITDWSTVYLSINLGSSAVLAGFGFAAFSAMMTLGRFNGDLLILRFGHTLVLRTGLVISMAGLLLLFIPKVITVIIGFGLAGLGYSAVVPIVFSQASKKQSVSPALGLASVATLGYSGFLMGPVLIGWLAEVIGLGLSFSVILGLTILAFVLTLTEKSN